MLKEPIICSRNQFLVGFFYIPNSKPSFPEDFICCITMKVMYDPVMVVESGNSYERRAIEKWFAEGRKTDPLSNMSLETMAVVPNHALRRLINSFDGHRRQFLQHLDYGKHKFDTLLLLNLQMHYTVALFRFYLRKAHKVCCQCRRETECILSSV